MRAMPTKVYTLTLRDVAKFRFLILQDAINAKNTSDRVTSFEFYDAKNKRRVNMIKELLQGQMANLKKIESSLITVKEQLDSKESLMAQYEALSNQWKEQKRLIANQKIQQEVEDFELMNQ